MKVVAITAIAALAVFPFASAGDNESTCGGLDECEKVDGEVYGGGGRRLAGPTFGLVPPGGWSNHVTVACGLEWLWGGAVYPGDVYYNANPGELQPVGCPAEWKNSNRFPDCVKFSGFRLPTKAEIDACFPIAAPPCLATYVDSLYSFCNPVNNGFLTFVTGFPYVAASNAVETCYAETVYVRYPNTPDSCVERGVNGDPHFKTWVGGRYDFHGACDLVLLKNPDFKEGLGMDIHIRTKFTDQWSYVDSAVLSIGDDTLEVRGQAETGSRYWLNKIADGDLSNGIGGFRIEHNRINSKQDEFIVTIGSNEAIVFKTWKNFVRVNVRNGTPQNFETSLGLMGSYSKGLKLGRDGKTIIEDNNEFGLEWQVLPAEEYELFHNLEGVQAPHKCAMPDTSKGRRRRLSENIISSEDAAIACSRVNMEERDACIFDVLATNDKDMAGAY